jgi:hypothetical protein|tara:strand:+ start:641 stop:1282 length:642 start_codon:yes stop_codon:yes gene_type:complete
MIITGADTNHEDLLPWWLYNVKTHNPNIDVMIWDFGLSLEMQEYLHKNNVNVSPPLKHPMNSWFYKPRAMLETPSHKVCWIDADCEVLQPLDEIFNYPTDTKMALTKDLVRPMYWATGVNVIKGKPDILMRWVERCENNPKGTRGDQECLGDLIGITDDYIIEMPQEYQWLRLMLDRGYDSSDKKIIHWTGPIGKQHIRQRLMNESKIYTNTK